MKPNCFQIRCSVTVVALSSNLRSLAELRSNAITYVHDRLHHVDIQLRRILVIKIHLPHARLVLLWQRGSAPVGRRRWGTSDAPLKRRRSVVERFVESAYEILFLQAESIPKRILMIGCCRADSTIVTAFVMLAIVARVPQLVESFANIGTFPFRRRPHKNLLILVGSVCP